MERGAFSVSLTAPLVPALNPVGSLLLRWIGIFRNDSLGERTQHDSRWGLLKRLDPTSEIKVQSSCEEVVKVALTW